MQVSKPSLCTQFAFHPLISDRQQPLKTLKPPFSPAHELPCSHDNHLSTENHGPLSNLVDSPHLKTRPTLTDPRGILQHLPTAYRDPTRRQLTETKDNVHAYLEQDLDVSRLTKIQKYLWMAGRPRNTRPLHRQLMMDRHILATEQADLHLLWEGDRLFLKPLPSYLLRHLVWEEYICNSETLHRRACGLLLSYVWLICSELDFRFAIDMKLFPPSSTWPWWQSFTDDFLSNVDHMSIYQVDERYYYGELRLGRINTIYRLAPQFFPAHLVRGYIYDYNRYSIFLYRNFGWLAIVFAYFSIILSAMQVGLAAPALAANSAFLRACYGFSVFSVTTTVVVSLFLLLLVALFFVYNFVATVAYKRKCDWERARLNTDKSSKHV